MLPDGQGEGYPFDGVPPQAAKPGDAGLPASKPRRSAASPGLSALDADSQDAMLRRSSGATSIRSAWPGLRAQALLRRHAAEGGGRPLLRHPTAWSEIGFGGPASPRGYVRIGRPARSWEASAIPGRQGSHGERLSSSRRRTAGRPTCSLAAAGSRCASYRDERGGRFRHRRRRSRRRDAGLRSWPRPAFRWWPSTPGRSGGRWRTSRRTRRSSRSSTGPTSASSAATIRSRWAATTAAAASAARTVHFAMVSLRFRPEWFKSRTHARLRLSTGRSPTRDGALLRRGRAGAQGLRPGALSLGPPRGALSLSPASAERLGAGAGARRRGARHRLGADAARHRVGAARRSRRPASIAASATSAARPTPSRARWWSGSPGRSAPAPRSATSRWSAASRWTRRRARHRRPLSPRGPLALPEAPERRRRRLRDRDAAAAAQLGLPAVPGRARPTARAWSAPT